MRTDNLVFKIFCLNNNKFMNKNNLKIAHIVDCLPKHRKCSLFYNIFRIGKKWKSVCFSKRGFKRKHRSYAHHCWWALFPLFSLRCVFSSPKNVNDFVHCFKFLTWILFHISTIFCRFISFKYQCIHENIWTKRPLHWAFCFVIS